MAENVDPRRQQGSPIKPVVQELSSKATPSQNPSPRLRSPLKDIANSTKKTSDIGDQKYTKISVPPPGYDAIKELDEEEGWRDRAEVVTRLDHVAYLGYAKEVVEEVVNMAVSSSRTDGDSDRPAKDHTLTNPAQGISDEATEWTASPQKEMIPEADSLSDGLLHQERSPRNVPGTESLAETSTEVKLHTTQPEILSENPEQDENDTTMQEEFFDSVEDMEEMPVPNKGYNLDFLDGQDIDPFKTKSSVMNSPDNKETTITKVIETVSEAVDKADSSQLRQEEVCSVTIESYNVHAETINTDMKKTSQKEFEQKADESASEDTKNDEAQADKSKSLDFLSKLDDSDHDPFKTSSAVANSPDQKEKTKLHSEENKSVLQDRDSMNMKLTSPLPKPDDASPPKPSQVLQLDSAFTTHEKESGCGLSLEDEPQKDDSGVGSLMERTITEDANDSQCPQSEKLTSDERVRDVNKEKTSETPEEFSDSKEHIEEKPVPSKGYNLDFLDNFDETATDPFKTRSSVMNSPDRKETEGNNGNEMVTESVKTDQQEQEYTNNNKDSEEIKAIDITVAHPGDRKETLVKDDAEISITDLEKTPIKEIEQKADESAPEDTRKDESPAAKGYNTEFLSRLDDPDFDPFKTTSAVANSPHEKNGAGLRSEVSQAVVTEDSSSDVNISSSKSSDTLQLDNESISADDDLQFREISHKTDPGTESLTDKSSSSSEVRVSPSPPAFEVETKHIKTPESKMSNEPMQGTEDMPVVPSKGYNLDILDTLDGQDFNPFQTKSAVMNSPDKNGTNTNIQNETKSFVKTENSPLVVSPSDKEETLVKDHAETVNTDLEKIPLKEIERKANDSASEDTKEDEAPAARGYNLDFLNNLNDPDFDPFKTTTTVANSPDEKDKVHKKLFQASDSLSESKLTESVNSSTPPVCEGEKQYKAKQPGGVPSEEPAQVAREENTSDSLEEIPVAGKGYNIDHLDETDIDPFKTKSSVMNSPVREEKHDKTDEKEEGADVLISYSQVGQQEQNCKSSKEPNKNGTPETCVGNSDSKPGYPATEKDKLEETTCTEKSREADSNSLVDVFSPFPKPRARQPLVVGGVDSPFPNAGVGQPQEDDFKTATDFFNNMEDIDFLSQHGTQGDKVNLARNSLYVKFDPLVGGRLSMAPYIAQQFVQRCGDEDGATGKESGLICFSPSPKKHMAPDQSINETTGGDLSGASLEHSVFYGGGNDTFVAAGNNTTVCNTTVVDAAANKTIILQQPIIGEKNVPEREMISELKKMELIMQDKLLRKSREYEELLTRLQLELQENSVVRASLEEENSTLRMNVQQMQSIVTKIKKSYDKMVKDNKEKLEAQDIQYRDQLKSQEEKHKVVCQQYMEDVEKMEGSFIDQVKKYERLREVSEILRKNNAELKTAVQDLNTQMTQKEEKFKSVIKILEDDYAKGQQECDSLKEHYESELKKAQLIIRRSEIEMISLKETVEKKTAENQRLSNLLDEMSKY